MAVQKQARRSTADDVYQLSLQGEHYELLDGELIEVMPTKLTHGRIANWIAYLLTGYVVPAKLGAVYAAETGYALTGSDVLAPHVSFITKARIPPDESKGFAAIAPDLAVEVFSPNNTRTEMQEKANIYFRAGTRLLWVVYPRSRTIYVYTAADRVTILQPDSVLDGGDVLPDFCVKVSDIFSILDEA